MTQEIKNQKTVKKEVESKITDPIMIEKAKLLYGSLEKKYPEIMNAEQVAKILQLRPGTIRNWTMKEIIPHCKLNGAARYVLSEIVFWLLTGPGKTEETQKKKRGRPSKTASLPEEILTSA